MVLKFSSLREVKVCPTAFARAHNRGHTYYDKAVKELKEGRKSCLFKNHSALSHQTVLSLIKKGGHFGLKLTKAQFTQLALPSTTNALTTAAWLERHFKYSGKMCMNIFSNKNC